MSIFSIAQHQCSFLLCSRRRAWKLEIKEGSTDWDSRRRSFSPASRMGSPMTSSIGISRTDWTSAHPPRATEEKVDACPAHLDAGIHR
jgi:hypothetical protein